MPETISIGDFYTPQNRLDGSAGPQTLFHASPARYPLLEGGRGGGKSAALCWEAIRECIEAPGCNCLLLRRTLTASEKGGIENYFLKFVPRRLYKNWNGQGHVATFRNGSQLFFGHIKSDRDLSQYQSAEFLFIGWDELTQFTYSQWDYLKGSNRSPVKLYTNGQPTTARMGAATNPNGIGSGWVKALWITKKPPAGEMCIGYNPADYEAIHSTYEDNFVYRNDADYISGLTSISDPVLRAAWIPGSWEILAGQYFQNWDGKWDPEARAFVGRHIRTRAAVQWLTYEDAWISIDWGYQHATCVLWWTRAKVVDGFGREKNVIVCYREYVTRRMNEEDLAKEIAVRTGAERISRIFLSPDRFTKENSEHSIADTMGDVLREYMLPRPERANDSRVDGWRLISTLLDTDGVVVLDQCRDVIESIPKLQRDEKKIEDARKEGNELFLDVCESFRYGLMSYADENAIPREMAIQQAIQEIKSPTAKFIKYLELTSRPPGADLVAPVPQRVPPWKRGLGE